VGAGEVPRRDFEVLVDFEVVSFGMFPLHALVHALVMAPVHESAVEIHSSAFVGCPVVPTKQAD
jgi:hypothetical protein